MELKLNKKELRILWGAINQAQANGMLGLERLKNVSTKFPEWELETIEELITLQKIKIDIDLKLSLENIKENK